MLVLTRLHLFAGCYQVPLTSRALLSVSAAGRARFSSTTRLMTGHSTAGSSHAKFPSLAWRHILLIIFAGLPGAGKTTLARTLASKIGAVFLRIDSIENAMCRSTLDIPAVEDAGYMVGYAVAEDNLRLGRLVVADSVNAIDLTRSAWLRVAERAGNKSVEVEVVCSDPVEHRRRIETREADLPDQKLPTWQAVLDRAYQPWERDRIVIDTARRSVEDCVEELLVALSM